MQNFEHEKYKKYDELWLQPAEYDDRILSKGGFIKEDPFYPLGRILKLLKGYCHYDVWNRDIGANWYNKHADAVIACLDKYYEEEGAYTHKPRVATKFLMLKLELMVIKKGTEHNPNGDFAHMLAVIRTKIQYCNINLSEPLLTYCKDVLRILPETSLTIFNRFNTKFEWLWQNVPALDLINFLEIDSDCSARIHFCKQLTSSISLINHRLYPRTTTHYQPGELTQEEIKTCQNFIWILPTMRSETVYFTFLEILACKWALPRLILYIPEPALFFRTQLEYHYKRQNICDLFTKRATSALVNLYQGGVFTAAALIQICNGFIEKLESAYSSYRKLLDILPNPIVSAWEKYRFFVLASTKENASVVKSLPSELRKEIAWKLYESESSIGSSNESHTRVYNSHR